MSSRVGVRGRPRPLVLGKVAEIGQAEFTELLAARAELENAKLRLRRVTARLELAIGDAEFAAIDGRAVIWRQQGRTGGRYVRVNHRDDMRVIPQRIAR